MNKAYSVATIITLDDPQQYGSLVLGEDGHLDAIAEYADTGEDHSGE